MSPTEIPVVDVAPLVAEDGAIDAVAAAIDDACRTLGFFQVVGHGVRRRLFDELADEARKFFALPEASKQRIAMPRGGRAWRGWFPLGGEITSGRPDHKEGLYFGAELDADHPRVRAGRLLHGPNLFPIELPALRPLVLEVMERLGALGHHLMAAIAVGLGLPAETFASGPTMDPLVLFRIFHYPPHPPQGAWSVGEHTDYGLLTILHQDDVGGLEVKTDAGWLDVPPVDDAFVVNLGDMLDRMTGGRYRSTPHRVRNRSGRARLSFPFFFDPDVDARIEPLFRGGPVDDDAARRWDRTSVHDFSGRYEDWIVAKLGRVFPGLRDVVDDPPSG